MRLQSMLLAVATGAAVLIVPATAHADGKPSGPNPFLSLVPDSSTVDYAAWRRHVAAQSAMQMQATGKPPLLQREAEPAGTTGANDSRSTAEPVRGFGSRPGRRPAGTLQGQLATAQDVDFYRVDLQPGDVFAAKAEGAALRLSITDPAGVEVQGSAQDFSSLYPAASPLPRGGNAIADHVAAVGGAHYLAVSQGTGDYTVTIQVHGRPLLKAPQTIFLDFDGAQLDSGIFPVEEPGLRTLSPLRSFLGNWGLTPADEPAVIRQIVRTVKENLIFDVRTKSNNPLSRIVIKSSLDGPDPWGRSRVSRIVVGGTVEELGLTTIGIAQSIDPGNFATEETAVVLQDFLSRPAGVPYSLNTYLQSHSDRVAFVGRAIGNVVSHEAGHYLGGWHTDPTNTTVNLLDAGGAGYTGMFGTGPDGVGGTADDTDTDLTVDAYRPTEGFTGFEDSLNRVAFGT